jgi:hypothetical protein
MTGQPEETSSSLPLLTAIERCVRIAEEQAFTVKAIVFRSGLPRGDVFLGLMDRQEAEIEMSGAMYKVLVDEARRVAEEDEDRQLSIHSVFGIPLRHES